MRLRDRFLDGRIAHFDELGMEWPGLDLPEAFPRNLHVALLRKALGGVLCLLEHLREFRGVEMALVERDAAFLDDARHDPGLGGARTDRADPVAAALRDLVNLRTHFRRSQEGVLAPIHRRAAGMRRLPEEGD